MNIQRPKPKESLLSRGWHDLSTPMGASILGTIVLCAIISIIIDYIGERYNISTSIIYPIIIVINIVMFFVIIQKLVKASRIAAEKRKEAYRQKFGGKF